jgi:signal transduction histidine kinase/ligand-binding sensor domain-containing protein/AraC-like DNA-binding protein
MNRYILLVSLFAAAVFVEAHSMNVNEPRIVVKRLSGYDGLVDNKVLSITQDSLGRIWTGTTGGVSCFDSRHFTNYVKGGAKGFSLSNNNAQAILAMPCGDVWVATSDSLNVYSYSSDGMSVKTLAADMYFSDLTTLAHGSQGVVWIGTHGNGIVRYDNSSDIFSRVEIDARDGAVRFITALAEDNNGFLWIGSRGEGLFRYDTRNGECRRITAIPPDEEISCVYQDRGGNIWIGTTQTLHIVQGSATSEVKFAGVSDGNIRGITQTSDGLLWVGGENTLVCFDPEEFFQKGGSTSVWYFDEGDGPDKISYKSVRTIFTDRDDNVWVGTYGGGLNLISRTDGMIGVFYPSGDEPKGMSDNKTMSIFEDSRRGLWFGMDGAGLVYYDPTSGKRTVYKADGRYGSLHDNNLLAVLVTDDGTVWAGGYREGLACKPAASNRFTRIDKQATGNSIRAIYLSSDGTLWTGSERGLFSIDRTDITDRSAGLEYRIDVRVIAEDSDGILWLGTYGDGVVRYDAVADRFTRLTTHDGLRSNIVYDLLPDGENVWVATEEGLSMIESTGSPLSVRNFDDPALSPGRILSIESPSDGTIWIATREGLVGMQGRGSDIKTYVAGREFRVGEYSEGCSALLADGRMMFGGFYGVNILDGSAERVHSEPAPVIFTGLSIYDRRVSPTTKGSVLTGNLDRERSFILSSRQNFFTVDFVSPEYNREVHYAYKLDTDRDWNSLSSRGSITFRDLPPRLYRLDVRSIIPGSDNSSVSSLTFRIQPAWWQTWWAISVYIAVIVAIIYLVWLYLSMRIQKARDAEVNEAKLTFFTNISHELRTPLTLLIAPLDELQRNETNENKLRNLHRINQNAGRLLSLVNQILDFRKAEQGVTSLGVAPTAVFEQAASIVSSFAEAAADKEITLSLETEGSDDNVWIDSSILDKIVFNLLSNSFKFTPTGGSVSLRAKVGEKTLTIIVTDNGRGIGSDAKQRIFERFYQDKPVAGTGSGIGLHLVKTLAELHHGTISYESIPNVSTSFVLSIPCRREEYREEELARNENDNADPADGFDRGDGQYPENIEADGGKSRPRIIVADDNDEIRSYLAESLSELYEVTMCADGGDVVDKCASGVLPDLIVCDVMMPGMDGIETVKALRGNFDTSHIPIVLLTAKSTVDDMIEGLEVGADAYISKPFNRQHLMVQIRKLLETREILRRKYRLRLDFGEKPHGELSQEERFLKRLGEIVKAEISDPELNGDIIAGRLKISRSSLHRKLKSLTGLSAGDFIRNMRLSEAARLMCESDRTIAEICFDLGFNNPSYFTTCFTTQYGVTPKQYRQGAGR